MAHKESCDGTCLWQVRKMKREHLPTKAICSLKTSHIGDNHIITYGPLMWQHKGGL